MTNERMTAIAANLLACVAEFNSGSAADERTRLNYAIEHIKMAVKESSQEKDEVIRKLVDSVDDPQKLLRALNTLG